MMNSHVQNCDYTKFPRETLFFQRIKANIFDIMVLKSCKSNKKSHQVKRPRTDNVQRCMGDVQTTSSHPPKHLLS